MQVLFYRPNQKQQWLAYKKQERISFSDILSFAYSRNDIVGEIAIVETNNIWDRWNLKFNKSEGKVIWRGRLKSCFPNKWQRIKQNGRKVWRPVVERQESFKWIEKR